MLRSNLDETSPRSVDMARRFEVQTDVGDGVLGLRANGVIGETPGLALRTSMYVLLELKHNVRRKWGRFKRRRE